MKGSVLTQLQVDVLVTLFEGGLGDRGYYLTGGSALAEYYLQHRQSDDLDFFTRAQHPLEEEFKEFRNILIACGLEIPSEDVTSQYARFSVGRGNRHIEPMKIEFARDVPAMMSPPQTYGQVVVDSFEDIAVNKVCAILNREPSEPKDFVDLFFIIDSSKYTVEYLLRRAREKEAAFDHEDGLLAFATNLLRVQDLSLPLKMIKPLRAEDLRSRLTPLAQDIIRRLRPGR